MSSSADQHQQQTESRITKRFCDDSASHGKQLAPDFKPTTCVSTTIFTPGNNNSNNNNNAASAGNFTSQRLAFSQSVWPNLSNLPKDGSVKLDIGATLVSVCNITGQLHPVAWPSSSKSAGSPLKVAFQKIVLPGQQQKQKQKQRNLDNDNDDDDLLLDDDDIEENSNNPKELLFPKCSQRKTAARSFSFISVVNELVWACEANTSSATSVINTLQHQTSVNATILTSFTNEWLNSTATSSAPSGSSTICLVFVVGIRLTNFDKLWQSPHLRESNNKSLLSDTEKQKRKAAEELERAKLNEKVRTHKTVLLREDDDEDDPWALRGSVCVISTNNKSSSAESQKKMQQQQQQQQAQQAALLSGKSNSSLAARFGKLKSSQATTVIDEESIISNKASKSKNIFAAAAGNLVNNKDAAASGKNNDEDDIVQLQVSIVSLRCPLSLQIMTTPTKGRTCEHDACFELSTFVTQSIGNSSWNCPHCDRPCYFGQLMVDPIVETALNGLKKENQELLILKQQNGSSQQKKTAADRAVSSDDDDDDDVPIAFDRIFVYPSVGGKPRRWEKYSSSGNKESRVSED